MTMTTIHPLTTHIPRLRDEAPCTEALAWLQSLPPDTTPQQAWDACERADWMLWLAEAAGVDLVTLQRCACAYVAAGAAARSAAWVAAWAAAWLPGWTGGLRRRGSQFATGEPEMAALVREIIPRVPS